MIDIIYYNLILVLGLNKIDIKTINNIIDFVFFCED